MITLMFKGRSRSQIINKFHKEEKQNPELIERTLNKHKKRDNNFLKTYGELFNTNGRPKPEPRNRVDSMDSTDQVSNRVEYHPRVDTSKPLFFTF